MKALIRQELAAALWANDPANTDPDDLVEALLPVVVAAEARGRAEAVARAVQAVEALRPHIPPSTDPDRRTRVIQRSSFNRAASAVRALVAEKDVP